MLDSELHYPLLVAITLLYFKFSQPNHWNAIEEHRSLSAHIPKTYSTISGVGWPKKIEWLATGYIALISVQLLPLLIGLHWKVVFLKLIDHNEILSCFETPFDSISKEIVSLLSSEVIMYWWTSGSSTDIRALLSHAQVVSSLSSFLIKLFVQGKMLVWASMQASDVQRAE